MSDISDRFLARLGKVPDRPPAAPPRIERRFEIEGILFEHWIIRGARGDIPAYLLMDRKAPAPAPLILALHPHGRQFELGKSLVAGLVGDGSRAYGRAAAREGFAVLVPDLVGFEDHRPPLARRKSNYALQGEYYERLLAMQALVEGSSLQAWILSDLTACLETAALDSRVDAGRAALLGQSFGGQEVIYGMLFDRRFRAGIASCGFSLVRLLVERCLSHNLALYLPGMLPDLDFDSMVAGLAPRPLYVIAGRLDPIFPAEGVEEIEKAARRAYERMNAGDRIRFHYFDGPHDLPAALLAASLTWLKEHL